MRTSARAGVPNAAFAATASSSAGRPSAAAARAAAITTWNSATAHVIRLGCDSMRAIIAGDAPLSSTDVDGGETLRRAAAGRARGDRDRVARLSLRPPADIHARGDAGRARSAGRGRARLLLLSRPRRRGWDAEPRERGGQRAGVHRAHADDVRQDGGRSPRVRPRRRATPEAGGPRLPTEDGGRRAPHARVSRLRERGAAGGPRGVPPRDVGTDPAGRGGGGARR